MIVALLIASLAAGAPALAVPMATTAEVVLDGQIDGQEWASAARIDLERGVVLLVMADAQHLALAVKGGGTRYTDLFVMHDEGTILNLHASMQTGQRKLSGTAWTDTEPPWGWGNNTKWRANTVAFRPGADPNAPFAKQIVPYDGQEFLIERGLNPGNKWVVRIEARDFTGTDADVVWPAESTRYDPNGWKVIALP
jgi:hypothetical protein